MTNFPLNRATLPKFEGILLDRDGVINQERRDYVKCWREFRFLPHALHALAQVAMLDVPVLVITNQSAIGRGIVRPGQVDAIHDQMQQEVSAAGGRIDQVFVCPHRPDENCLCRKPRPGLLEQAMHKYQLRPDHTVFIGDSYTDFQAAQAAGCWSILVRTGLQGPTLAACLADHTEGVLVDDLSAAASLLAHT